MLNTWVDKLKHKKENNAIYIIFVTVVTWDAQSSCRIQTATELWCEEAAKSPEGYLPHGINRVLIDSLLPQEIKGEHPAKL